MKNCHNQVIIARHLYVFRTLLLSSCRYSNQHHRQNLLWKCLRLPEAQLTKFVTPIDIIMKQHSHQPSYYNSLSPTPPSQKGYRRTHDPVSCDFNFYFKSQHSLCIHLVLVQTGKRSHHRRRDSALALPPALSSSSN